MTGATMSMMLDSGLTDAEKSKLSRVQDHLAMTFAEKGFSVRLCQGSWYGNCRMIEFGPPVLSIPSSQFLSTPDDQLAYVLDPAQGRLNTPVAVYAVDGTIFVETVVPNVIRQYRKGEFLGVFTHRQSFMAGINSTGKGEDGRPKDIQQFAASQPAEWPHEKQFPTTDG